MSHSFYLTNSPTALYTGSNNFSTRISATPTDYGLTEPQAEAYAALNDTYAAAFVTASEPATRTRPAIQARNDSAVPLRQKASELAKIIDATPTVTNEQRLELGLNVPKIPGPVPAPGTPYNARIQLDGDGSLILKFKCNNPAGSQGTIYNVFRQIGGSGAFNFIGGVGQKKFVDSTIPAGATQLTYKIQAVRSTAVGMWATFNVLFGTNAGGSTTAAVTTGDNSAPKLAA